MKSRKVNGVTIAMAALVLGACSSDPDEIMVPAYCKTALEVLSVEQAGQRLAGTWSYTDPVSMCTQTYIFASPVPGLDFVGGEFSYYEAQEEISGLYVIVESNDGSGPQLEWSLQADNRMPDCAGVVEDDSGSFYISKLGFPSVDEVRLSDIAPPHDCSILVRN